jgi:hypothetical protein
MVCAVIRREVVKAARVLHRVTSSMAADVSLYELYSIIRAECRGSEVVAFYSGNGASSSL